jgi:hypothetical protein
LFVHTFVRRLITREAFATAHVSGAQYLNVLRRGADGAFTPHPSWFALFALLSVVAWLRRSIEPGVRQELALVAWLWLAMLGHFLAFPMLADRFFVAGYAGVTVLCVAAIAAPAPRASAA